MKTREEIEEMAKRFYNSSWEGVANFDGIQNETLKRTIVWVAEKIYTQAQQDLINEASEGWEDHFVKHCEGEYEDELYRKGHKAEVENTWQAARISIKKELSEVESRYEKTINQIYAQINAFLVFKKEALEVIGFYADEMSYASDADNTPNYHDCIDACDIETILKPGETYAMAGKRARAFLAKHSEEKGDL